MNRGGEGKPLKFRNKPVTPLNDENGYSFFFMEKNGVEYWLKQLIEPTGEKSTQWVKLEDGKDPGYLGRQYLAEKGLEFTQRARDDHLIKQMKKETIEKDEVKTFFDELGPFIQTNNLSKPPGDPSRESPEKVPESFQDYPENIQKGALKVIEDPNIDILLFLISAINQVHVGDTLEVEFNILKEFSPHVTDGEPVHIRIMGGEDSGKTDLSKTVLKIVPTRWQLDLTSVSPKYLYYSDLLREDYNHAVFNDVLDNEGVLPLLKVMADNVQDRKPHRTVIDKKPVEMEIPGRNTITITAKKDINDPETERRFLHLNPQEDSEHKNKVKEFIKQQGIIGVGNTSLVFELCRAIFDKLVEKPLKVFNPWIECLKVENLGNTDLKIFIGLVKARAIIYQGERHEIDEDTILGTREDVEEVLKLWFKISPLQQYKISKQQLELLKELPVYDQEVYTTSRNTMREEDNHTLEGVTGKTLNELGNILKRNPSTIRTWIKGYNNRQTGQEKPGLESLGFIISKTSNPDKEKAPILFYLNPEKEKYIEGLKEEKTNVNDVESKINDSFTGSNSKNKLIKHYLRYINKINLYIEISKEPFFKEDSSLLKTDKNVYNIICSTREALETLEVEEIDPVDNIINTFTSGEKINIPLKQDEKPQNVNKTPETITNKEINKVKIGKNGKEPVRKEELLLKDNLLNYIRENPNNLEGISQNVSKITGTPEEHINKILTKFINGGILRHNGDSVLEVVEGEK